MQTFGKKDSDPEISPLAIVVALAIAAIFAAAPRIAVAQAAKSAGLATLDAPPTGIAPPGDALRPGHLGRQVGNEEQIVHFYHDLIGLELRGTREQPRLFG